MQIRRHPILLIGVAVLVLSGAVGSGYGIYRSRSANQSPPPLVARPVASPTDMQITQLQQRLRSVPDDTKAKVDLADGYLQKARETGDPTYYGKAEPLLMQALASEPENFNAMTSLGSLALSRHQFLDALKWGQRAHALNPAQARIYGVIGDAQIELGQYPEAVATFQTMVDTRPDLSSYARVSYARELYGDLDGAIDAMQKAIVAGGPYTENTVYLRAQLANIMFNRGDLTGAEQMNAAALRLLPRYAPSLAGLAKVDAARGNYLNAIGRYQQAVDQMPLPEYVIALGDVQEAAGKPAEAARSFALARVQERLFTANGVDVDVELSLFDADHNFDPPATLALAKAARERRPSIKGADALAWAYAQSGDYQAAQPVIQDALHLGTQDPLMLFHAGMIAYHRGDLSAARTYLERVMALNPQFSVRYAALAKQTLAAVQAGGTKG